MELHCQDLSQHGVILIPSSSADYNRHLAAIARIDPDIAHEDLNIAAILLNESQHSIAAIQTIWTFRDITGRTYTSSWGPGTGPSVLLPFGLSEKLQKVYGYWNVILPGSKRLITNRGRQFGDNSDVRPPNPDELSTGGGFGGGGGHHPREEIVSATLTLESLFFDNGAFLGPNRQGLWDQIVTAAETHQELASLAAQMHEQGDSPSKILAAIESITGPFTAALPPPMSGTHRERSLGRIAHSIGWMRQAKGDEWAVHTLAAWNNQRPPNFHKL